MLPDLQEKLRSATYWTAKICIILSRVALGSVMAFEVDQIYVYTFVHMLLEDRSLNSREKPIAHC